MLILPDVIELSDEVIERIKNYVNNGGKVIASGTSLVKNGEFILDTGAKFKGENDFNPTYLVPGYDTVNGLTEYIMRCNSYKLEAVDCDVCAYMQNPYFNRTLEHFCSHAHAPNNPEESFPGAVIKGNVAYIGWDVFTAYAKHGHICFKELFTFIARKFMSSDRSVYADIPDRAVVTLTRQENESRSILHLLFAHTTVRGQNTEVIEDTVPLYNVKCKVKCDKMPSKVTLVPAGTQLSYEYIDGFAEFTVPEINIHQMISIED